MLVRGSTAEPNRVWVNIRGEVYGFESIMASAHYAPLYSVTVVIQHHSIRSRLCAVRALVRTATQPASFRGNDGNDISKSVEHDEGRPEAVALIEMYHVPVLKKCQDQVNLFPRTPQMCLYSQAVCDPSSA